MKISNLPFGVTDWANVPVERKAGETGWAEWRVRQFGDIRVRMLTYSPGYKADHWCVKGHVLLCVEGELTTELQDGRTFIMRPGMSYQVADGAEPHRSLTATGATLFVVD
jgi:quercetin dioxygenase-like cupin family protein